MKMLIAVTIFDETSVRRNGFDKKSFGKNFQSMKCPFVKCLFDETTLCKFHFDEIVSAKSPNIDFSRSSNNNKYLLSAIKNLFNINFFFLVLIDDIIIIIVMCSSHYYTLKKKKKFHYSLFHQKSKDCDDIKY